MPSLNQGEFIEESLRSILAQDDDDFELLVMDGGSTDGTVELLEAYAPWLDFYRTRSDEGQARAVAEGWGRSAGTVVSYLNSDDALLPGALRRVRALFDANPAAGAVVGGELRIDAAGHVMGMRASQSPRHELLSAWSLPQPAVFLKRHTLERIGGVDSSFQLTFDFELWLRLVASSQVVTTSLPLAVTRVHPNTLSIRQRTKVVQELRRLASCARQGTKLQPYSPTEKEDFETSVSLLEAVVRRENNLPLGVSLAVTTWIERIRRRFRGPAEGPCVWHAGESKSIWNDIA